MLASVPLLLLLLLSPPAHVVLIQPSVCYPFGVIKPQVRDILMRHLCPRQEIIIENA